jgi:hypothetical protein
MKNKELSFYAHPHGADRWKIATPFGNYIIKQEEDTLGEPSFWIETPAGHRIETEVINALDVAEQIVSNHYHKHYTT